jgi:hypothetical protein
MKIFEHGETVEDQSGTVWTVWEQKGEYVLVYIPHGAVTVIKADDLR